MGNFTSKKGQNLETFEWDNVWWEHTENNSAKRILYIGDSISCGVRNQINLLSKQEVLCDGFGTSKALDNPHFKPSLELFMQQQNKCDVILFNNGLHGWHLSDAEYKKYFDEMLCFLSKAGKPIYILLTTNYLSDEKKAQIVKARNEIAKDLAIKHHIPTIDLYSVSINHTEYYVPDCVHFNDNGYEVMARLILENIF